MRSCWGVETVSQYFLLEPLDCWMSFFKTFVSSYWTVIRSSVSPEYRIKPLNHPKVNPIRPTNDIQVIHPNKTRLSLGAFSSRCLKRWVVRTPNNGNNIERQIARANAKSMYVLELKITVHLCIYTWLWWRRPTTSLNHYYALPFPV